MFLIGQENKSTYTFLSLFSGAGGLDLGFEKAGFEHIESSDILDVAVRTMRHNRPNWNVLLQDVQDYYPQYKNDVDVLLAGFLVKVFHLVENETQKTKGIRYIDT